MIQQPQKATYKLLTHFIKSYPLRCLGVLVALLIAGIVEIIGISALLPLLNLILENNIDNPNILSQMTRSLFDFMGMDASFTNLLLLIVITISLKAYIYFHAMKIVAFASADITKDFRVNLVNALLRAKWQYYSTLPIGRSANAISTEAELASNFYTMLGKTIAAAIQTLIYAIIAFLVDWKVSLFAILMGAIGAFCLKFLINIARTSSAEYTNSLNLLLTRLTESLSGAKPLKAMGQEQRFTDLLQTDTENINQARKKTVISNLSLTAFHEPMVVIFIAIGLFVMLHVTNYPVTELLLIAFLFHRLIGYANQIQASYQKTITYEAATLSILNATQSAEDHVEKMDGTLKPVLNQKINFDSVTLAYGENIILKSFTDHIPVNKMTVIFGPSGIGKSTILDSILGFISPMTGEIKIDDIPLSQIDIKQWRHHIGYVPQETYLFHDTILRNITLGDPVISDDMVINALKQANAWEFIENLDDGINHIVGERGGKLSGGQQQRIALARALVRNPKILILDEATTGLDKQSEEEILKTLNTMRSTVTIIAISHDPKILDYADHIIKLEKLN